MPSRSSFAVCLVEAFTQLVQGKTQVLDFIAWDFILFKEVQAVNGFVKVTAYASVVPRITVMDMGYELGQLFFSEFHFEGF